MVQTISADAFRLLMETVPDGFFVHDVEGRLLDVNARSCADLGYERDELLTLTIGDISRGQPLAASADKWRDTPVGATMRFPEMARRKDGSTFPVEISLTCQVVDGRKLFLGLARDLSGVQGGDEPVLEDGLTGLASRQRLDTELVKACFHATRTGEPVAVAMIDVDHFGLYNDDHGAVPGDEALRALATILASIALRPYDLAARHGGDRFVLLLPGVDSPEALLNRIGDELTTLAIAHPGSPAAPHLTVSIGCVVASELADVTPPGLLSECERALRRAKTNGRNRTELIRM
jgi:diguanylate cyclase (GGDEF)-like protein/PAS domain S-box-containing protein